MLAEKLTNQEDLGKFIDRIDDTVGTTCTETFKHHKSLKNYTKGKSVPWWSTNLTIMGKKSNALRKRYQRTLNNEELISSRKDQYIEEKKKYQAATRKEKTNSWKEHFIITTPNNPWNEVYRLAARKNKRDVNSNHSNKTGRLQNDKHRRNSADHDGPTYPRRQHTRRHYSTQEHEKTCKPADRHCQ